MVACALAGRALGPTTRLPWSPRPAAAVPGAAEMVVGLTQYESADRQLVMTLIGWLGAVGDERLVAGTTQLLIAGAYVRVHTHAKGRHRT
jgi:hypothetical protein